MSVTSTMAAGSLVLQARFPKAGGDVKLDRGERGPARGREELIH
jgi:hypothetical protein